MCFTISHIEKADESSDWQQEFETSVVKWRGWARGRWIIGQLSMRAKCPPIYYFQRKLTYPPSPQSNEVQHRGGRVWPMDQPEPEGITFLGAQGLFRREPTGGPWGWFTGCPGLSHGPQAESSGLLASDRTQGCALTACRDQALHRVMPQLPLGDPCPSLLAEW